MPIAIVPPPPTAIQVTVLRVIDGDTIVIKRVDGRTSRIRFACIDAPERSQKGGDTATAQLKTLLPVGSVAKLNVTATDRYQRLVAEVWNPKGEFIQGKQIQAATVFAFDRYAEDCPNFSTIKTQDRLNQKVRAGVWGIPGMIPPWEYRALH